MNPFSSNSNPEIEVRFKYDKLSSIYNSIVKMPIVRPDIRQPEVVPAETAQEQPSVEASPLPNNVVDLDKYRRQRAQNGAVAIDGTLNQASPDSGQQEMLQDSRDQVNDIFGEKAA